MLTIIDYNIIKLIVLTIRVDFLSSLQLDSNCQFNFRSRIIKTFESN